MRQALVQNAEHDVDGKEGSQDQQRLRADRLAIGARIAGIFGVQRVGNMQLGHRLIDKPRRLLDGRVLVEAEADGDGGKLTLVVDHERGEPAVDGGHGTERHLGVVGAADIDAAKVGRIALILRIDFEHDAILVALGVERRDLALRERVVERIGDVLHAHPEPRGRNSVDRDIDLQAALFAVGRDIDQPGQCLDFRQDAGRPEHQFVVIGIPQRELVGGIALAASDPHILHREEKYPQPRDVGGLLPQPVGHGLRIQAAAFGQRLETDKQVAAIDRGIPAGGANGGTDIGDGWIVAHHGFRLLL